MLNKTGLHNDIAYVLVTEEELRAKVKEIGAILTEEYRGKVAFTLFSGISDFINRKK